MKITNKNELLVRLLLSITTAFSCSLMLYFSTAFIDVAPAIEYKAYYYTFLMLLLVTFVLALLLNKAFVPLLVLTSIGLLLSVANYYTYCFHGTILTYHELKSIVTVNNVISSYHFRITKEVLWMLLTAAVNTALLVLTKKYLEKPAGGRLLIPLFFLLLVGFFYFVYSDNRAFKSYYEIWSWEEYYHSYGFIAGTIENVRARRSVLRIPDGYDESLIVVAPVENATASDYPDIVFVLNETWYDIEHLIDIDTDADCMVNYRSLLNCVKGYACVPIVGGGTNDSEYELLTGNSISLLNVYSPFLNFSFKDHLSIVEYLKRLGYSTMAAHTESGANYHRRYIWSDLGFDRSYFQDDFKELEYDHTRPVPTDSSAFKNFIKLYEEMPEDSPRFAFLLTMQNHGDWNSNPPEADTVHCFDAESISEYDVQRLNEFLSSIKLTDEFIDEMLTYYDSVDRRVIVCMVGDHAPTLVHLFKGNNEQDDFLLKRQVPYYIWSNYVCEESAPENTSVDLCALTPLTLQMAGIPISPYYSNIIELSKKTQCFTNVTIPERGMFGNALGVVSADGSVKLLADETEEGRLLRNYLYSEYMILSGGELKNTLYYP